jgi:hypothetical protein
MPLLVFLTYPPISAADTADTFLKVPCNSLIDQLSASPPPPFRVADAAAPPHRCSSWALNGDFLGRLTRLYRWAHHPRNGDACVPPSEF